MYEQRLSPETIDRLLKDSPVDTRALFHELGFAIVKNNLALRCPDFPPEALQPQYEQMIGARIEGRFVLDLNEPVDPCRLDLLGRSYERMAHANGTRKKAGEFFTPPFIVDYMVGLLGLEGDAGLRDRKFIDIACGPGAFLVAGVREVTRSLSGQGMGATEVLRRATGNFYGLDISHAACDICKINVYTVLLNELGPYALLQAGKVRPNIYQTNAIDHGKTSDDPEAFRIKRRQGKYRAGFDYILGNPPYLEAKKMPAAVKEACRERWPEIAGAFDLYVPFILQCNRLLAEGGKVSLILPDKFAVAGYARSLRERLLRDFSLVEMADLSGMDVFAKAMVYPIVLSYEKRRPASGHQIRTRSSVISPAGLAPEGRSAMVPQDLYRSVGHNCTLFGLPGGGDVAGMLRRLFDDAVPLGDYVLFRSTVSFHVKGIREQFIRRAFDRKAKGPVLKYLGGRSYAKRNEVGLFRFRWEGYHINYDREALKELNNALPPLSNFTQEKIVLCQHAPRITAAYDAAGEFVTKDVYPIGFAAPGLARSGLSLKYLAALLNSELMSFVYGTIYKGIQVGGGYYHYLPTWIDVLPVIAPATRDVRRVERLADAMMATAADASRFRIADDVDEIVYRAYDIGDAQRANIRKMVPPWGPRVG